MKISTFYGGSPEIESHVQAAVDALSLNKYQVKSMNAKKAATRGRRVQSSSGEINLH